MISIKDLSFSYEQVVGNKVVVKKIFDEASMVISCNTALIGLNGCGKSTLLNIIYDNFNKFDSCNDSIKYDSNIRDIIYVGQNTSVGNINLSSFEYVIDKHRDVKKLNELSELISAMENESNIHDIELYEMYVDERDDIDLIKIKSIVMKLFVSFGFDMNEINSKKYLSYSGGWKFKIELIVALSQMRTYRANRNSRNRKLTVANTILLLDEISNHLDVESIEFVKEYLSTKIENSIFVLVSHDRDFISIADNIYQISGGKIGRENIDTKYDDMKIVKSVGKSKIIPVIRFNEFSIVFKDAVNSKTVIDMTFSIGDKIVLIGSNGSGKSTLLNIIYDRYKNTVTNYASYKGSFNILQARIKYLRQDNLLHLTNKNHNAINMVKEYNNEYVVNDLSVRKHLSKYGLTGNVHLIPFEKLSGGQRTKVLISCLTYEMYNTDYNMSTILLLDEPTNHLDIFSIDYLVDFVKNFDGCVIFSTHNTTLRNIATHTIDMNN